ncbi:hypothetical protein QTP70_032300 [Hemibagrus guttatus]|uniref:Membrane-spanning 4-domains subfamily A member 4A n=1 Tax=Hemibagrus guttatus TaxID=175788 RepID=A0AAE0RL46_9TELE|nr:hypothetical protein QTP70_032300 [Hemibagrus guttatus]
MRRSSFLFQIVQIIIGVLTFLFGVVLVSDPPYSPASVLTGNVFWASVVYIITGSLSVAAEIKLTSCLVQGSLGMNVVSAIFSAVGIGVLTTDFFLYYNCAGYAYCYKFEARSKAISGVLLVFTVLQFIISICVSAFACKATCSEPMVPVITYTNQAVTSNPQHVVYIQQTPGNTINPVPQNMTNWPSR